MNIITNGQWKEYVWKVLVEIDADGSKFEIPSLETLNKVAKHAEQFLSDEYPNMDPSGVKIASSLAYYFNALRPVFCKQEFTEQIKNSHKDYNDELYRIKLNAVVAMAIARAIVAYSYQNLGVLGLHCNPATMQKWQRLLVKRHYDENGANKIEPLSHYGMILSLSFYLDGVFPGRQRPW